MRRYIHLNFWNCKSFLWNSGTLIKTILAAKPKLEETYSPHIITWVKKVPKKYLSWGFLIFSKMVAIIIIWLQVDFDVVFFVGTTFSSPTFHHDISSRHFTTISDNLQYLPTFYNIFQHFATFSDTSLMSYYVVVARGDLLVSDLNRIPYHFRNSYGIMKKAC